MSRSGVVVCTLISLSIWLRYVLPVVDQRLIEYDPWHTHIVLGAQNPQEYAAALAHHHHHNTGEPFQEGNSLPHSTSPVQAGNKGTRESPQVLNISTKMDSRTTTLGSEIQTWLVPSISAYLAQPDSLWQTCTQSSLLSTDTVTPPPPPPPRFSV
jgi:hypothetical protein